MTTAQLARTPDIGIRNDPFLSTASGVVKIRAERWSELTFEGRESKPRVGGVSDYHAHASAMACPFEDRMRAGQSLPLAGPA